MSLGVLKLDHFADSIALLELDCFVCDRHRILRIDELVAKHSRFVSIPEMKQIGMPDCPRSPLRCRARFPQLERLFAGAQRESHAITMMSSPNGSGRGTPLEAPTIIA
jgi:hypothetical protein